jgi:hypothetical protein
MKKETVHKFLNKNEQEARKNKNEQLRKALVAAISECSAWIGLPWAEMDQPVEEKVKAMNNEAEELGKKKKQASLSEAEEARLNELIALYQVVYHPFWKKIWPTVRRAQLERKDRAQEKAGRN